MATTRGSNGVKNIIEVAAIIAAAKKLVNKTASRLA